MLCLTASSYNVILLHLSQEDSTASAVIQVAEFLFVAVHLVFGHLLFADDQLLIAQDYEDLEYMTRKLIDEYELRGLKLNIKKKKLNIWP